MFGLTGEGARRWNHNVLELQSRIVNHEWVAQIQVALVWVWDGQIRTSLSGFRNRLNVRVDLS